MNIKKHYKNKINDEIIEGKIIMNYEEEKFTTHDGTELTIHQWKPEGTPKGIVQIVHGIAEHMGRYMNVVNRLVPAGYTVCGLDLRGHGKSGGLPGFVNKFSEFVEDQQEFTQLIKKKVGSSIPLFLLGHSMGTQIAILQIVEYPGEFKGVILSGAGTETGVKLNPLLVFMAPILSKLLPKMTVKNELSVGVCSDPAVREAYTNDPYVLKKLTVRLGNELFKAYEASTKGIAKIKIPILIQRGEKDSMVIKTDELFANVTVADSNLKVYKDLFHEVYNEPEKDREIVLSDLEEWLDNHI